MEPSVSNANTRKEAAVESLRRLVFSAAGRYGPALASVVVLLAVNAYVVRDLFAIEYTRHMGSIEAAYIGISRHILENWGDLTWFPLWYNGIPFQNSYPPLLHMVVAAVAGVARISPALSHHFITAVFYCLGPVTLFWMLLQLSGSRLYSFASAIFYSVFSPSVMLMPSVRADIGSIFYPRRLEALVGFGEGPHVTSMTLLPVAIVCLDAALRKRRPVWYLLAALALSSVVLTNWLGGFALAAAVVAYLLSYEGERRRWLGACALGLFSYVLASPWIPPSTLAAIRVNAQRIGGNYTVGLQHLKYVGLVLVALVLLDAWFERRALPAVLRFSLLFSLFMGSVTLAAVWWKVYLLPQPDRYHLEMEMALVPALVFALRAALETLRPYGRAMAAAGFLLFCFFQMKTCRGYAAFLDSPIDIRATSEYKTAVWFDRNMKGQRVMAPGSTGFWLNAFTDVPQVAGGFDQGITNRLLPAALYQIYSGEGAGEREAEYAVLWLKALGVRAVAVTGPTSGEVYKTFAHHLKFEGHLRVLWRDGGDVVYEVPWRSWSLAHVVPREAMPAREPRGGLDLDPLRPYVAALDDPSLPLADFRWRNNHAATIAADVRKGQVLSVQISYHPGWHARVKGAARRTWRDHMGLLAIEPDCVGRCTVELSYDGGTEMLIARLASWTGLLGAAGWIACGSLRRFRKASPAP